MKINNELQEKSAFGFEDLRLYDRMIDFNVYAHKLVDKFPEQGKKLGERLISRSLNMAINIAVGSSFPDKKNFITQLRDMKLGIRECVLYITIARRLGYIIEEEELEARDILMGILRMSSAFISSIFRVLNEPESLSKVDNDILSQDGLISNF